MLTNDLETIVWAEEPTAFPARIKLELMSWERWSSKLEEGSGQSEGNAVFYAMSTCLEYLMIMGGCCTDPAVMRYDRSVTRYTSRVTTPATTRVRGSHRAKWTGRDPSSHTVKVRTFCPTV